MRMVSSPIFTPFAAQRAPADANQSLRARTPRIGLSEPRRGVGACPHTSWWDAAPAPFPANFFEVTKPSAAQGLLTPSQPVRLVLGLTRRSRQIRAEVALASVFTGDERVSPLTLFTGSWVAQLLGYGRKYRSTKLIETFTATAVRSYLLLYYFVPFVLNVKGPFANFNFFWRSINAPASQIFIHPITATTIWDLRFPSNLGSGAQALRDWLVASYSEFGRADVLELDPSTLEQEAKLCIETLTSQQNDYSLARAFQLYRMTWVNIFFMPTRIDRPRRFKKARSIRKRLAKRLVRASGKRFWVS